MKTTAIEKNHQVLSKKEVSLLSIEFFCIHVYYKNNHNTEYQKISPEYLANEFIEYFGLNHPLLLDSVKKICSNSDIEIDSFSSGNTRGWNISNNEKRYIFYKEDDSPSGIIHTILHELYEIIDDQFKALFQIDIGDKNTIEKRADTFSANVHVPFRMVCPFIRSRGLDVFTLCRMMRCSYKTALIRMNEALCNMNAENIFSGSVICFLYERAYWKKTKKSTPQLSLSHFSKSSGFPFCMNKKDIKKIKMLDKNNNSFYIRDLSKLKTNLFYHGVQLNFNKKYYVVDILIRPLVWKKFKNKTISKILIQINPTKQKHLFNLAEKLGLKPNYTILGD